MRGVIISIEDAFGGEERAVSETVESSHFRIYPNPATDRCFLYYPESVERVILVDPLGRQVHSRLLNPGGADVLDLSRLAPGLYFMYFLNDSGPIYQTRIVKSN